VKEHGFGHPVLDAGQFGAAENCLRPVDRGAQIDRSWHDLVVR
jgi:hypothetical protein